MTRCARFGRVELGHRGLARDARRARVLGPGGAIDEQRRGIDVERHVGDDGPAPSAGRQRRAEQLPRWRRGDALVERAARKAERGGADGGAEHVERRHRDLEAVAGRADHGVAGTRQSSKRKPRQRMRRDRPRCARRSTRPGVSAGTMKAESPWRPAPRRCARRRRRGRRCRRSRSRSSRRRGRSRRRRAARQVACWRRRSRMPARSARRRRCALPARVFGSHALALRCACRTARSGRCRAPASRRRNRRGPSWRASVSRMMRQACARRASIAGIVRITARVRRASRRGRALPRARGRPHRRRRGRRRRDSLAAQASSRSRQLAVARLEEWPGEEALVRHAQSPAKRGFSFATKAS